MVTTEGQVHRVSLEDQAEGNRDSNRGRTIAAAHPGRRVLGNPARGACELWPADDEAPGGFLTVPTTTVIQTVTETVQDTTTVIETVTETVEDTVTTESGTPTSP